MYVSIVSVYSPQSMHLGHLLPHKLPLVTLEHPLPAVVLTLVSGEQINFAGCLSI